MPVPIGYTELSKTTANPRHTEAVWTYLAHSDGVHYVLPDGRCDIILRFEYSDNGHVGNIDALIAGPSTISHSVPLTSGLGFIGIRIRPGFARAVLGLELSTIANQILDANDATEKLPALLALCQPADCVDTLNKRLTDFLDNRLDAIKNLNHQSRPRALLDTIHIGAGRLSVNELAQIHRIDERTVRRDIKSSIGLTPKKFSMILQFHRAIRLIRDTGLDLISAALESGYADQAHMTRAFRKFGGFTPAQIPDVTLVSLSP